MLVVGGRVTDQESGLASGEFLAPDGIIIRLVPGADSALTSVVIGVIPPREDDYAVHLHYGLEQVTYVQRGQVTAIQQTILDAQPVETPLGPGQAITTPPGSTLSFRNAGPETAEVLFVCVPPYPPSNADTALIADGHRPATRRELKRVAKRLLWAQEYLSAQIGQRVAALGWLDPASRSRD